MCVVVDAIPPDELHGLFSAALEEYMDEDLVDEVREREEEERSSLGARLEPPPPPGWTA